MKLCTSRDLWVLNNLWQVGHGSEGGAWTVWCWRSKSRRWKPLPQVSQFSTLPLDCPGKITTVDNALYRTINAFFIIIILIISMSYQNITIIFFDNVISQVKQMCQNNHLLDRHCHIITHNSSFHNQPCHCPSHSSSFTQKPKFSTRNKFLLMTDTLYKPEFLQCKLHCGNTKLDMPFNLGNCAFIPLTHELSIIYS